MALAWRHPPAQEVGELQLSVTHEDAYRAGQLTRAEPCECCGWPLLLLDILALIRELSGLPSGDARPSWLEVHDDLSRYTRALRPHTPERCRRIRAGDPEPWTDPEDDE